MGSFFDFMGKMIQGKPVFDAGDKPEDPTQSQATVTPSTTVEPAAPLIRKEDQHTFPVAYVKHVVTHFGSNDMKIYCHIVNTWSQPIELDKIRLLDTKRELDAFLRAGEEREFLVYDGPKMQRQVHEAQLDYKTHEEGDYFEAIHDVTFTYHAEDKTYSVDEMHLRLPIRDIYG